MPKHLSNPFGAAPFRALAEHRTATMAGDGSSGLFHPAVKVFIPLIMPFCCVLIFISCLEAQLLADQNIPGRKKRKKDAEVAESKAKKLSKSLSGQQTFTMVLVEGTKLVARGVYHKPNATKCVYCLVISR
jgi:hypothetical protein